MSDTYICAQCKGEFKKGWSETCDLVCDDCYKKIISVISASLTKKSIPPTGSTYSNNNFQDELTLDKLKEIIAKIEKIPDPYQEFAKDNGFDLEAGDLLFIPCWFAKTKDLPPRKNVIFSEIINDIFLMKGKTC